MLLSSLEASLSRLFCAFYAHRADVQSTAIDQGAIVSVTQSACLVDMDQLKPALWWLADVHRSSSQASGLSSGPANSRSKSSKDVKERESRDQAVDAIFDRKRVPLEALVRKSSPIAVVKKEEPVEPQVGIHPALHIFGICQGFVVCGTHP